MGGERPDDIARRFERSPPGSTSGLVSGNAFRHLGVACFGGCHISPRRRQGRNQALGVAALARASTAEDEREAGAAERSGRRQDVYAPGMSCPIRTVNPTPMMAAPASRGASSETSPLRRANSAVATVSALWIRMRPRRYAWSGDVSAPKIDSPKA